MLRWAQSRWGHLEASPRIPPQATFLSFLSIGVFVGFALFMVRR